MHSQTDILQSLLEVRLPRPDHFLIVRETLTRIGTVEADGHTLCQLCHILHKQGRYFITHFKELFALDGAASDLNEADLAKRNAIVMLLVHWNLVHIQAAGGLGGLAESTSIGDIKVVPYQEKAKWTLTSKYTLGKHKRS